MVMMMIMMRRSRSRGGGGGGGGGGGLFKKDKIQTVHIEKSNLVREW